MHRCVTSTIVSAQLAIEVSFCFFLKGGKFLIVAKAVSLLAPGKNYWFRLALFRFELGLVIPVYVGIRSRAWEYRLTLKVIKVPIFSTA